MELTVNGVRHDVISPPLTTLLNVLREELYVTSPKAGCEQGGCGACTVHVDGRPRRACLLPLAAVEGAEITTVEGLSEGEELSTVQAAFHEHYAAQCGFCTSGFVMAAEALVGDGERRGATRSSRRSAATSAAAPATRRSSTPSPPHRAARGPSTRAAFASTGGEPEGGAPTKGAPA